MRCNNLAKKEKKRKKKKDGLNKRAIESATCQNLILFHMRFLLIYIYIYVYIYIVIWFLNNLNKHYQKL